MFNYTKETIINDLAKVIAGTADNTFGIKRGGNYDLSKVVDLKIYKTKGVAGTKATIKATVGTALTAGATYRFSAFVETPNKELVDYAYPNWGAFGKAVLVEFAGKGAVNDDAKALAEALKLSLQPDNHMFEVSVNEDEVTLTFNESWMKVKETAFEMFDTAADAFEANSNVTVVVTANVEEFATAAWLVENLRFPSYPNVRYNALYADEAPVAGTVYNQYAFQYCIKNATPGGLSGVGQVVDSITTHVIYVPASLCAEDLTTAGTFEKLIQDASKGTSTIADGDHANEQVITLVVA